MFDHLFQTFEAFMAAHAVIALAVVFLAAFGESLLVVGLFVPGSVVLVAAGALVGTGTLPFAPVLVLTIVGAFAGDVLSYWIGRRYRDQIRDLWPVNRFPGLMDRGERFFHRYGGWSVFIGRFIPGVKAVIPGIAGMMGLSPARFVVFGGLSSVVFACVNILPAIGIGIGLDALGSANPRLLALLVALALVLFLAYRLARFAAWRIAPALLGGARRLADHAVARRWPGAPVLDAIAYNRRGVLVPVVWVALAGFAAVGFSDLAIDLTSGPALATSDQAISNLLQSFRTAPADMVMVAVTMAGDGLVLTAIGCALVAGLAAFREFRAAAAAAVAMVAAMAIVPFIKDMLARPRPQLLYEGADSFSFPSGHASLSMTVLGVVAVVLAHRMRPRWRVSVYAAAVTLAVLIAFSRIYLAAHWPSDVAAGLMFGSIVVAGFALSLHNRAMAIRTRVLGAALALTFAFAYGANVSAHYGDWMERYKLETTPTTLTRADWLDGGWRKLPARRIELDGETGERLRVQTDADPAALAPELTQAGWRVERHPGLGLVAALPASGPLESRTPLPLFHDGLTPVLTATRPEPDGRRTVLRLWPSGFVIGDDRPLYVGSLSTERLEPLALGISRLDDVEGAAPPPDLPGLAASEALRVVAPDGPGGPRLVTAEGAGPPLSPGG